MLFRSLAMQLRPSLDHRLRTRTNDSLAPISPLQARTHDLEELLRRGFGEVERDLIRREDLLVVRFNGYRDGGVGAEGEKGGDEGGGEGGVVKVDEALCDGKVVGGGKGGEELDEKVEDLWMTSKG